MSEPTVYELMGKQIDDGFERMDRRIDEVLAQQKLTNGRVREMEIKAAVHDALLAAGAARMEVLSKRSHENANLLQVLEGRLATFIAGGATTSFRQWLTREVTLILATTGVVIAFLRFFHMLSS